MPTKKKATNEAAQKPQKENLAPTESAETEETHAEPAEEKTDVTEPKAQEYTVTYKGGLNVRGTPSFGGKVVHVLKYGETVPVSEVTASGWGKTPNGYIKMQFVRKSK